MSAQVEINGFPVIDMKLCLPRCGVWHADLSVASEQELSGQVSLTMVDGLQLSGFVTTGRVRSDVGVYRIVGGRGGMQKVISPRSYQNVTARIVLGDILASVGETLSSTADATALATVLPLWVVRSQACGRAVSDLATKLGVESWRMLVDGTVWLGREQWPKAADALILVRDDRLETVEADQLTPTLAAGQVIDGRRASYVEWKLMESDLRAKAWLE